MNYPQLHTSSAAISRSEQISEPEASTDFFFVPGSRHPHRYPSSLLAEALRTSRSVEQAARRLGMVVSGFRRRVQAEPELRALARECTARRLARRGSGRR